MVMGHAKLFIPNILYTNLLHLLGSHYTVDPLELFGCEWWELVSPVALVAVTFADIAFTAVSLISFFVGCVSRWAR